MRANVERFVRGQQRYFKNAYQQFEAFGGPCVYFHRACLAAGKDHFLSPRHIEMLYATLTAWGLHRMGEGTKAKLTDWDQFSRSLSKQASHLDAFQGAKMLEMEMTEDEYGAAIAALQPCYKSLKLSISTATLVANSKALHHLLPDLVPPIDRQYTIRFFRHLPQNWKNAHGKFKGVPLPRDAEEQFELFQSTCRSMKSLADQVAPALFEQESQNGVSAPKALDNALVNFVRITAAEL